MPEYQNFETQNRVSVTGRVIDFNVEERTTRTGKQALKVSGQLGVDGRGRISFNNFIMKEKKGGGVRKDFDTFANLRGQIATVKMAGEDNASIVHMTGKFGVNDYVNKQGNLTTITNFQPNSAVKLDNPETGTKLEAWAELTSYIQNIAEMDNMLRVTTLNLNFRGDIIPFDFFVLEDLRDSFMNTFAPEQTIGYNIAYQAIGQSEPQQSAGIGVRRTSGTNRFGWVLIGADLPKFEGEVGAISTEVIKDGMTKRAAMLADIQSKGYQGRAGLGAVPTQRNNSWNNPSTAMAEDDWDLDY